MYFNKFKQEIILNEVLKAICTTGGKWEPVLYHLSCLGRCVERPCRDVMDLVSPVTTSDCRVNL
jgi:hypothetical protein